MRAPRTLVVGAAAALSVLSALAARAVPAEAGASSTPTLSAAALQAKAIADAENAGWVHEVGHAKEPGHSFSAVDDIGLFEGRQIIDSDGSRAEVVQIGQQAYIRGNAEAIANFFRLTKNEPQQLANTWISLVPSDGDFFSTVIDAVTLKSDFAHQSVPAPVSEGHPVTVDGKRCIPITGHSTQAGVGVVTITMCVTTSKNPLPVDVRTTSKMGTETTTWSRWGKPVTMTRPPDAVPLASLGG